MNAARTELPSIVARYESEILSDWVKEQLAASSHRSDLMKEAELREQSAELLRLLRAALQAGGHGDTRGPEWEDARSMLSRLSRSRGMRGFSSSETATFVFSLKQPLFQRLRREISSAERLADEIWLTTQIIDQLGLYTVEAHQKAREEIILAQQREMMELSTPVVTLADGVLALPLIGTLDSGRTQTVMEALLQRIVETESEIAIIDITGVPTVDTLTAQHLLKTVTATRLMGADCIISGIRPQIAQTIVHLGVNLGDVTTKASLASAFQLAMQKLGYAIVRRPSRAGAHATPIGPPKDE